MSLTKLDKNWIQKTINDSIEKALAEFHKIFFWNLATKEDLKNLVTKEEAKAFATKADLRDFATKIDLQKVENRLDEKLDTVIDRLDEILGNQRDDRQDLDLTSARVSDHEDRLQVLENK